MRHRLKPIALAGWTVCMSLAGAAYAVEPEPEAASTDETATTPLAAAPVIEAVPAVDTGAAPPSQMAEAAPPQQAQAETPVADQSTTPATEPAPTLQQATGETSPPQADATPPEAPQAATAAEAAPPAQQAAGETTPLQADATPPETPQAATAAEPAPPAQQAASGTVPQQAEAASSAAPASAAASAPPALPAKPAQPTMTLKEAAEILAPGVLTPKGSFVLDPSIQYSYSDGSRVALVGYTVIPAVTVGLIDIRQENRTSWTAAITGRYGVTNRMEVEMRIPYVYASDESLDRPFLEGSINPEVFNSQGKGISDVELAARYQLNQPADGGPYYVGAIRVKSDTGKGTFDVAYDAKTGLATELPTGSGFWGVQGTLSAILPSDPAVFFGSLSYMWNIARDVDKDIAIRVPKTDVTNGGIIPGQFEIQTQHYGDVDPGDVYEMNIGIGIGLNERSSMSLSYDHSLITKTKVNGAIPDGSIDVQVGILQLGWSYRINATTTTNLALGIGTTDASPAVQMTLRVPITF